MSDIINELFAVIEARKTQDPSESYVASLHKKGLNKILEKVGEEATETIIAAKDAAQNGTTNLSHEQLLHRKTEVVKEVADLWFHSLVMLSNLEIDQQAVQTELASRFGVSGLEEKRNRAATHDSSSPAHNTHQEE